MGGVAKAVSNVVSDTVKAVGNAVEDVGDFVDDEIIQPVVKAVDSTIEAAKNDPLNTAIRVAAFAVGGPAGLAIANGTIALSQGASIGDAAMLAGKTYVIGQAGAAAGKLAGAAATSGGYGVYAANTASGAAAGATGATLSGGDAQTGLIMGGLGGLNKSIAQSISDQRLEDWSRGQAEQAYENSYAPTEQDVLAADPSIKMDFPLSTPTDATGSGYYNEMTGEYIPSEYGQYQAPLTDASGTNSSSMDGYTYDPNTSTWTTPDGAQTDLGYLSNSNKAFSGSDLLAPANNWQKEGYDPLVSKDMIQKGLNFATNAILNDSDPNSGQRPTGSSGMPQRKPTEKYATPELISGNNLLGDNSSDEYELARLRQLYGSITPTTTLNNPTNVAQTAPMQNSIAFNTQGPLTMASGGSTDSSKSTESVFPVARTGVSSGPIMGGGQRKTLQLAPLQQLKPQISQPRMAKGGLPAKYAEALPAGHKPEFITGLTGYYASGKGTGQSDDIDAMLHDGDYVADADLVAALGDGSSKAGAEALEKFRRQIPHQRHAQGGAAVAAKIADGEYVFPASFVTAIGQGDNKTGAKILDKMREAIRAHKRSAPTTKIPPKAKSPLEYLKMAKG